MGREYDRAENLHWLDVVDNVKGDPMMIARVIGAVVHLIFKDPYWAPKQDADGLRFLHSVPVVFDGIVYAFRVGYWVEEYAVPRDGKRGIIHLENAEPYDVGDVLDDRPWRAREH